MGTVIIKKEHSPFPPSCVTSGIYVLCEEIIIVSGSFLAGLLIKDVELPGKSNLNIVAMKKRGKTFYTYNPSAVIKIEPGDTIIPLLLAANRDPEVFAEPDTFDIGRDPNPHIAFGQGIHFCIGAPLARIEGAIAIMKLIERFPNLRLNADPKSLQWGPDIIFQSLSALPLRYQ